MSILSMIFTPQLAKLVNPQTNSVIISFDATPSVKYEMNATLTKSQIEDGTLVSDHVTFDNKKVSFNIVVTDAPLNYQGYLGGIFSGAVGNSRSKAAFKQLENLRDSAIPFNAVFEFRPFKNAILTNFTVDRTAKFGNSLVAQLSIEEAKIVTAQFTNVKIPSAGATNIAASPVNQGMQGTTTATAPQNSWLMNIKNFLQSK